MHSPTCAALLAAAILAALGSSFATADDSGWYVGGNLGESQARIDNDRITRELSGVGLDTASISADDHHLGYKLFGGYEFGRYFALEGGYFDLGRFGFTADTRPPGTLTGDTKLNGLNLDVVGILPVIGKLSALGRIGLNYAHTEDNFAGAGSVIVYDAQSREYAANYKFGVGLQYEFTDSLGLRAEAERYRIDDAIGNKGDIDLYTVGLLYRFGRGTHATVALAPAAPIPDTVTSTPEPPPLAPPAPVPDIVPVPVATQRYCSLLDIQFDVNDDEVHRQDKEKLRVVGIFLTKYPDTSATIEGYTDNVGTASDNLALSQRRAESVVGYLETTFHIDPSRLTAKGYGDTRPIADNLTQAGKRSNRRIDAVISCVTDISGLMPTPARITMALAIDFDPNKSNIEPRYYDELLKLANFLRAHPAVTATVEGHTANLHATPQLALQVSRRRAQSVVDYLVTNFGIARSRLSTEGFGQTRRFAYNTTLEGRQENRRVNVIINYPR